MHTPLRVRTTSPQTLLSAGDAELCGLHIRAPSSSGFGQGGAPAGDAGREVKEVGRMILPASSLLGHLWVGCALHQRIPPVQAAPLAGSPLPTTPHSWNCPPPLQVQGDVVLMGYCSWDVAVVSLHLTPVWSWSAAPRRLRSSEMCFREHLHFCHLRWPGKGSLLGKGSSGKQT